MQAAYLASLLVTLAALLLIDRRYRLVFYADAWRAVRAITVGVIIFSAWDLLGIHYGIFFSGDSRYMLGWFLLPEYPIEELFFLTMLCYISLLLYQLVERRT